MADYSGMQVKDLGQQDLSPFSFDRIIVGFSGGKDSIACVLHLLELGIDKSKIELWHHNIDGREGSHLMDWESTPSYCRAFAAEFGLAYFESWREGGFEREMLRNGSTASGKVWFETPEGLRSAGGKGTTTTVRQQFPQTGAITSGRWCSAVLKIDVMAIAINNQSRFEGKKTLVVTGERAQESTARALYPEAELHRCNAQKRFVVAWRPVHKWLETDVWAIIRRHRVNPHPAYRLGWGRLSCMACIFGNASQWRSVAKVDPERFDRIAKLEGQFGKTINQGEAITDLARRGTAYEGTLNHNLVAESRNANWNGQIRLAEGQEWVQPAGAYQACGGPT